MRKSRVQGQDRTRRLLDATDRILLGCMNSATLSEAAKAGLDAIERVVGSQFGFVAQVNVDGTLDTIALTDTGWEACHEEHEKALRQLRGMKVRGYWSQPIVTGMPVLVNDPDSNPARVGTPKGHPTIKCYLGIPMKKGTKVTGLIALANKPGGFTQTDVEDVSALSLKLSAIIQRLLLQTATDDVLWHYRSLFSNTLVGAGYHRIVTDEQGNPIDYVFLDVNPAFEALTGLKREEVIGKRVTEVMPTIADGPFDWIGTYGQVALTGQPATFAEYSVPLGRWYLVSASSPEKHYFTAYFIDIGKEELLQAALRESSAFAEVLFENAPVSLWHVDLSQAKSEMLQTTGPAQTNVREPLQCNADTQSMLVSGMRIKAANQRTLELLEATTSDEFQVHLPEIITDERISYCLGPLIEGRETQVKTEATLKTLQGKSVDVVFKAKVVPGHEEVLDEVVVSALDVTALKQAERRLRDLNEDLDRRVKERTAQLETANEELESFSYSASHDLRAPLRATDGFSKRLLDDYSKTLDEKGVHYLERVRAATQRMGTMIDDMLRLSRITRAQMKREQVDVTSMAKEIAKELQHCDESRHVEFAIQDNIVAEADGGLLRSVLDNLMGNAWKFSRNNQHARIEVGTKKMGENTVYFVRDNGVGFDMQYADKLFAPFQRLHSQDEFEGTGIGLATVRRIIRRHAGKVWAESIPGEGATFYFTLHPEETFNDSTK